MAGKGDGRRKEDIRKIWDKWDNISWSPKLGQKKCEECGMITSSSINDKCFCERKIDIKKEKNGRK